MSYICTQFVRIYAHVWQIDTNDSRLRSCVSSSPPSSSFIHSKDAHWVRHSSTFTVISIEITHSKTIHSIVTLKLKIIFVLFICTHLQRLLRAGHNFTVLVTNLKHTSTQRHSLQTAAWNCPELASRLPDVIGKWKNVITFSLCFHSVSEQRASQSFFVIR